MTADPSRAALITGCSSGIGRATALRTYAGPPRNIAGRLAVSADDVAAVIARAASTRRPRARYPVGSLARGLFALQHWLPGRAFDAFIRTQFPAPRPPP